MKIGFLGLGAMGHAMARRLLEAGHELAVWNRTQARADDLVARGARRAASPADAAGGAEIVLSMLFDDAAVEAAVFGPEGVASALAPGAIHACCGTISLDQARRLRDAHAERGQGYASATVLGRPPAAEAGTLFVVAAGAESVVARLAPVLEVLGQRVFLAGEDPAQANLVKLSLNFLIMSTIEQMAEVFALNEKAGIDPKTVFEIMTGSFYNAPVHRNYGKMMVERVYDDPGASVRLALKDTEMVLAAGHDFQVPLPHAALARDRCLAAMAAGDAERDFVVLTENVRRDAGLAR
ncbi:NAD(P)-dependent oxidoreductase [Gluconacetobacter takamatsuzukensis]|uniref:NAD(P)-dependent oxidoreductase n=1 Tax=Gluconacetobacter takamatsuzukensis TaxID=1286190 RepID=A0A7W4KED2_9PROT|nr:NAD(P)-dependent oxidoreductase [Gluconacetobacter takamatsuzukensis]MBB2205290.1 NAD(P)-dependent oxidoreductase [Gluconacetobacter takamatsuzukensis]